MYYHYTTILAPNVDTTHWTTHEKGPNDSLSFILYFIYYFFLLYK